MNLSRRTWLGKTGAALFLGGGLCAGRTSHAQTTTRATASAARTVVLGQSVPLTGAASEIGLAFAAGCRLYATEFNESGASSGIQLKLLQLDDGYDAGRTGQGHRLAQQHDPRACCRCCCLGGLREHGNRKAAAQQHCPARLHQFSSRAVHVPPFVQISKKV